MRAWKEATSTEVERQRKEEYKKRAKQVLVEAKEEVKEEEMGGEWVDVDAGDGGGISSVSGSVPTSVEDEERWAKELDLALQLSLQTATPGSSNERVTVASSGNPQDAEEEQFSRDMEKARQMSLESSS